MVNYSVGEKVELRSKEGHFIKGVLTEMNFQEKKIRLEENMIQFDGKTPVHYLINHFEDVKMVSGKYNLFLQVRKNNSNQ